MYLRLPLQIKLYIQKFTADLKDAFSNLTYKDK